MLQPSYRASAALAAGALLLGSSAASATKIRAGYQVSWGKPNISLEEYWIDASQCGHAAAATDLADSDPAKALVYATRMIDNADSVGAVLDAYQLVAPEVQWDRAAKIMERSLERCLTERGYVKFRLTGRQFRELKKLALGSLERREFLHRLASDPAVLAAQAV